MSRAAADQTLDGLQLRDVRKLKCGQIAAGFVM
jgi:hypothetical protein